MNHKNSGSYCVGFFSVSFAKIRRLPALEQFATGDHTHTPKMKGQWMISLLVTGLVYVSGDICDTEHAKTCYTDLLNYESRAFPLYGQGTELDKTCDKIGAAFSCVEEYYATCHKNPECDDECQKLTQNIVSFSSKTGIRFVELELCDFKHSVVRHAYLENYECLESNLERYSACHNKSDISKEYLDKLPDEIFGYNKCCYVSWYYDCFTNITRDHCDMNATVYVTFGLLKLLRESTVNTCNSRGISCSSPPLPPKEKPDKDGKEASSASTFLNLGEVTVYACDTAGIPCSSSSLPPGKASIISCAVATTAILLILFMKLLMY